MNIAAQNNSGTPPRFVMSQSHDTHYHPLLKHALEPDDSRVRAYAAAIDLARTSSRMAGRCRFGLDASSYTELLNRHFPGAPACYRLAQDTAKRHETDEFDDVVLLLLNHMRNDSPENRWLAHAIAAGCMGDDHLWQDLGLCNRQALSTLLADGFPELYARNTQGMRWKKFFYRQLCEQSGAKVCRSPSCQVCSEYNHCFGSEEDETWQH